MTAAMIEQGRSPRTASHARTFLRTVLKSAQRWGLVSENVAALSEPPRVESKDVEPLAPDRAQAIPEAVRGDRLQALFDLVLVLGLRQSEALAIQWDDVDFDSRELRVRRSLQRYGGDYHLDATKTRRSRRTLALPDPVVSSLRAHRTRQLEERLTAGPLWDGEHWGDLVFCTALGRPLHGGSMVTKRFQSLLERANLPRMTFHELRHGAATLMLAIGVDLRTIMETLGHSQISTTMNVYSHVVPALQRDASERVGRVLFTR